MVIMLIMLINVVLVCCEKPGRKVPQNFLVNIKTTAQFPL